MANHNGVPMFEAPKPPVSNGIGKPPLTVSPRPEAPAPVAVEQAVAQERREQGKAYLPEHAQQLRQKPAGHWRTPAMKTQQARWRAARRRKQTLWREAQRACGQAQTALAVNDYVGYAAASARLLDLVQIIQDEFREIVGTVVKRAITAAEDAAIAWKERLDDRMRWLKGQDRLDEFNRVVREYIAQRDRRDPRADWTFDWLGIMFDSLRDEGLFGPLDSLVNAIGYAREAVQR